MSLTADKIIFKDDNRKVHLTQFFSLAKVKLGNTYKKNLPNFSVSDTFKGLKN